MKRQFHTTTTSLFSSFDRNNSWKRYFLSLDGQTLSFFPNKFSSIPSFVLRITEFVHVTVAIGNPIEGGNNRAGGGDRSMFGGFTGVASRYGTYLTRWLGLPGLGKRGTGLLALGAGGGAGSGGGSGGGGDKKQVVEDIHNVVLTTKHGDEIYMR